MESSLRETELVIAHEAGTWTQLVTLVIVQGMDGVQAADTHCQGLRRLDLLDVLLGLLVAAGFEKLQ